MNRVPGKVIVIGGGVIGAASAYFLSKAGWSVAVIERGEFGRACSHGNCGLVCPSHVLPLAEPGAIGRTVKALFQKNSPFTIKPRLDPQLWLWLLKFARRCNRRDMLAGGRALQSMLNSSMALYRELIAAESIDCEWEKRGLLYVYRSAVDLDAYTEIDHLLREEFDLSAMRYDGEATQKLEPALQPGVAGAWFYNTDAHLRPDKLLSGWRHVLERRGVEIREHCELLEIAAEGRRATQIRTATGDLAADVFVVATGALTPLLHRQLGCRIPIQPGKGYSLTMPRPAICPTIPLIFPETRVAVTPMQTGYRLGSTMEFAGYDETIREPRLELLKAGARPFLKEPYCEPIVERWFGWRPMTWDSLPYIDRCPGKENLYVAAGHNMLGLSMAPATGKLIAELVGGETPHLDPRPFAIGRA